MCQNVALDAFFVNYQLRAGPGGDEIRCSAVCAQLSQGGYTSRKLCEICGADSQFICERCLRCEACDGQQDRKRPLPEQHLGKWLWSRNSIKGTQLDALVIAGHGKGDYEGKKVAE